MPIIFDIEENFSLVYPSMYIIFKVAEKYLQSRLCWADKGGEKRRDRYIMNKCVIQINALERAKVREFSLLALRQLFVLIVSFSVIVSANTHN